MDSLSLTGSTPPPMSTDEEITPPNSPPPYIPPERKRLDPSSVQPSPLTKYKSWSPEIVHDETWMRRKTLHNERRRKASGSGTLSRSVTDEDLDELRGCIDLGFGFGDVDIREDSSIGEGSNGSSNRLAEAFPALDLYYAVNREYSELLAGDGSAFSESSSAGSSPISLYSPGDSPHKVKEKLKRWAQVVACSVRQRS